VERKRAAGTASSAQDGFSGHGCLAILQICAPVAGIPHGSQVEQGPRRPRFLADPDQGGDVMDIAHRDHFDHKDSRPDGHSPWLGVGGIMLVLLLIAAVLAMSTRSTQMASNDAQTDWSGAAPPVHPLIPHQPMP
jgi:hypothetical protein